MRERRRGRRRGRRRRSVGGGLPQPVTVFVWDVFLSEQHTHTHKREEEHWE
jgi:hypothetical protein